MLGGFFLTETYLGGLRTVGIPSTAFQVLIDGIDRVGSYRYQSLTIQDELEVRNTCDFVLIDSDDSLQLQPGETVLVLNGGVRIFGGTIDSIEDEYPSFNSQISDHIIRVTCTDFNAIADRFQVAETYETVGQTAGDIVNDLITDYLADDGVAAGEVQDGFQVGKVLFDYNTIAQALDELARLIGFSWNIDYDKRLHFFDRDTFPAPWSITDSVQNHLTLRRQRSRERYRNLQRVRGGKDITETTRTREFRGDGNQKTFRVDLPVAKVPTIAVDGSSKTVGIQEVDSGKDWYWQKGERGITQDAGGSALSSSQVLSVTYQGFFDVLVELRGDDEIESRQIVEGGSGIYEAMDDDPRIDNETLESTTSTSKLATQKAEGFLRQFARIPIVSEIATSQSGLRAGMIQSINLTREKLSGKYLIVSVETVDPGLAQLRYVYRIVDGEKIESPYKYFQMLATQGRKFVIRDNEVLMLIRQTESDIALTDTLTAVESSSLGSWTQDPYTVGLVGSAVTGKSKTGYPTNVP
jgi:hypothetical protein